MHKIESENADSRERKKYLKNGMNTLENSFHNKRGKPTMHKHMEGPEIELKSALTNINSRTRLDL